MVTRNKILTIIALTSLASSIHATTVDYLHSLIAAPWLKDTVIVSGPIVIGFINDTTGKPLKKKQVVVYIDKRIAGIVQTNKYGVWSYMLNSGQLLSNGVHMVQAYVQTAAASNVWTQASLFYVDASRRVRTNGPVSAANSSINFPYDGAYINTSTPTIVGSLVNATFYPVISETVHISINGVNIATVTSDSNGVFSYQVTNALSDGDYTVGAHCVQSDVDLATNGFTILTTPPPAPTITNPLQDDSEGSSTVIVAGTTEANATVTIFIDGDTFGDICYADEYGNWSNEYDGLPNGSHSVSAQATDVAENTGPVSDTITFTVSA
jgi:hypothetical protein